MSLEQLTEAVKNRQLTILRVNTPQQVLQAKLDVASTLHKLSYSAQTDPIYIDIATYNQRSPNQIFDKVTQQCEGKNVSFIAMEHDLVGHPAEAILLAILYDRAAQPRNLQFTPIVLLGTDLSYAMANSERVMFINYDKQEQKV